MIVFAALLGCGANEDSYSVNIGPKGKIDEDSGMITDLFELGDCAELPYVTWDSWAKGTLTTHCQGCHASQTPTTYGAPTNINFDTHQETLIWRDRIRARVLISQDMPPAGGILEEDLYLLQVWLDCWSEE